MSIDEELLRRAGEAAAEKGLNIPRCLPRRWSHTCAPASDKVDIPIGAGRRSVGLVGCVKQKATGAMKARDLYISTLFRGRQAYVESSCDEWWILSAGHGLVHPDQVISPYDVTLKNASRADRRAWTQRVLLALDQQVRLGRGTIVEIHAGADYREFGLLDGLRARGCETSIPTLGMPIGSQLQFYARSRNSGRD